MPDIPFQQVLNLNPGASDGTCAPNTTYQLDYNITTNATSLAGVFATYQKNFDAVKAAAPGDIASLNGLYLPFWSCDNSTAAPTCNVNPAISDILGPSSEGVLCVVVKNGNDGPAALTLAGDFKVRKNNGTSTVAPPGSNTTNNTTANTTNNTSAAVGGLRKIGWKNSLAWACFATIYLASAIVL